MGETIKAEETIEAPRGPGRRPVLRGEGVSVPWTGDGTLPAGLERTVSPLEGDSVLPVARVCQHCDRVRTLPYLVFLKIF